MKLAILLVLLTLSGCAVVAYKAMQQCTQENPCKTGMVKIYEW